MQRAFSSFSLGRLLADRNFIVPPLVDRLEPLALLVRRTSITPLTPRDVVQARITAMPGPRTAQLEILGQTFTVETSLRFEVGATVDVEVHRTALGLEFVIEPGSQERLAPSPETVSSAQGEGAASANANADMGKNGLAVQAAINRAVLGLAQASGFQLRTGAASAREIAAGVLGERQLQSEVRARYGLEPETTCDEESAGEARAKPSPVWISTVADEAATPSLPGQTAPSVLLAFQLPTMPQAVQIQISWRDKDDENEEQPTSRTPATRHWSVRFSLDGGALGEVRVSIGLSANAVSVHLAASEKQSADFLNAMLLDLRTGLEENGLAVEELFAVEAGGAPPERV